MLTVQRMFRNRLKWKKKNHKIRHNKFDNKRIGLGLPIQRRKSIKASEKRRAKSLRKQRMFPKVQPLDSEAK